MNKLLLRQRGFAFAILVLSLSVTTVLWSMNIMTNVSLLESTTTAATTPDDGRQGTIPDKLYHHQQQHAPRRYGKIISKKRPWNQPDLTFTLKRSAVDGSSSSSSTYRVNRQERIKAKKKARTEAKKRRTMRKKKGRL
jgi:hypothetical protein